MLLETSITIEISQDLLISLILYLFYNTDLLEKCDNIKLYTSVIEFVDDINILIYSKSIKRNY